MSRFSRADAEARGWKIVHEQEPETVVTSQTQGEVRVKEGRYIAEKYWRGDLQNVYGDTIGKLLEAIEWQENRMKSLEPEAPEPAPEPEKRETSDGPFHTKGPGGPTEIKGSPSPLTDKTVITPGGDVISEGEFKARVASGAELEQDRQRIIADKENARVAAGISIEHHDQIVEFDGALVPEVDLEVVTDEEGKNPEVILNPPSADENLDEMVANVAEDLAPLVGEEEAVEEAEKVDSQTPEVDGEGGVALHTGFPSEVAKEQDQQVLSDFEKGNPDPLEGDGDESELDEEAVKVEEPKDLQEDRLEQDGSLPS